MEFHIRPWETGDLASSIRLSSTAGWNQLEEDWRALNGGFVAEREGILLGTVGIVRHGGLAWIAMMLVDPAERGAGIGRALMERVLDELRSEPCVGLDATPMGHPLYLSCGLVDNYELVRTKLTLKAPFTGGVGRPMEPADLDGVLARDRDIFGADRTALLRRWYERTPEMAWVSGDAYCFGRPGRLFHQLGPVCAPDRESAEDVVASCLAHLPGRTIAMDIPQFDTDWLERIAARGFLVERPFTRMFLRGHKNPGDPARQFAIAGPEYA